VPDAVLFGRSRVESRFVPRTRIRSAAT